MKLKTFFTIACTCCLYCAFAFSDTTIAPKDLKQLTGCWKGSITYLDYTTNKPFSMPAELLVKDFKNSDTIICALLYPEEPKANTPDTILVSKDGKLLNNERITAKKKPGKDSLVLTTEIMGIDGNDHKAALIRHTYILGRNSYSIKKEVRFTGQTQWILRHEYRFTRKKPCS